MGEMSDESVKLIVARSNRQAAVGQVQQEEGEGGTAFVGRGHRLPRE